MSRIQRGRRITGLMAFATAALVLTACSTQAPGSSGATASASQSGGSAVKAKIFMAPKFTGLAYFEVARKGGEQAGKDLGIDFKYIGSDKPEASAQIATLTNAIPQHPGALVVSAIDGDAVAPALEQARQAGIKVVTYDADAAVAARDIFVNQLTYELAAKTMLDAALLNSPVAGWWRSSRPRRAPQTMRRTSSS